MVQQMLNCRLHSAIKALPYEFVFNRPTAAELIPSIPKCIIGETHDDLDNDDSSDIENTNVEDDQTVLSVTVYDGNLTPLCIVCHEPVGGAHTCIKCNLQVHTICGELSDDAEKGFGSKVTCKVCLSKLEHQKNVDNAKQQSDAQAARMQKQTKKILSEVQVGQSVLIKVPEFDRHNVAPRNAIGVVSDIRNGMFEIGTENGVIDKLYSRGQFDVCSKSFLNID